MFDKKCEDVNEEIEGLLPLQWAADHNNFSIAIEDFIKSQVDIKKIWNKYRKKNSLEFKYIFSFLVKNVVIH